jgi:hypothetical protein
LRRVDRYLVDTCRRALRSADDPLVVDLGFGASPVTTLELADRLAAVRADVEVVGLDLDRERVAAASAAVPPGRRVSFRYGGFELPVDGRRPVVVRAMNVLRQYAEADVRSAWQTMAGRLAAGDAVVVEGTSDEIGRLASWLTIGSDGVPRTLTLAASLRHLDRPSAVAARLPKALIHHNVAGEPVHELLAALDDAWARAAGLSAFGARQRWLATVAAVGAAGWPVVSTAAQARRGEVTVAWAAVAPRVRPECTS